MQVAIVEKRLASKKITLQFSPESLVYLAEKGYNPQYGARPLKRLIQSKVLTPIATMMVAEGLLEGGVIKVGVKNGEFTFDVKKKALRKRMIAKKGRKTAAAA